MKLTFDEERIYNFIYEDGIIKYSGILAIIKYSGILADIDFNKLVNILVNLRKSNLIYSFIDSENNLCYEPCKDHAYYIKRKRSENLNKIKDETY